MDTLVQEQLQSLRARIEADLVPPAVVVVTSAAPADGKSLMAFGLARSMTQAGYKAVVVDTNHANPEVQGGPTIADLRGGEPFDVCAFARRSDRFGEVDVIPLTDRLLQTSTSKEAVEGIAAQLRRAYDVTIVDTTRLLRSHMGLLFAACADGMLLSIRHGRPMSADDGFTVRLLERFQQRAVWVVTATSAAIGGFARDRAPVAARETVVAAARPDPVRTYVPAD